MNMVYNLWQLQKGEVGMICGNFLLPLSSHPLVDLLFPALPYFPFLVKCLRVFDEWVEETMPNEARMQAGAVTVSISVKAWFSIRCFMLFFINKK